MQSHTNTIKTAVTKLEFLASVMANTSGDALDTEGYYFTMRGVIEEIKTALDGVEDRPAFAAINKIAS